MIQHIASYMKGFALAFSEHLEYIGVPVSQKKLFAAQKNKHFVLMKETVVYFAI